MRICIRRWMVSALVVAALALGGATLARAQMGSISGQVSDLEGKPMADATILIKNTQDGSSHEVKTDKKGFYYQSGLRGGNTVYEVSLKVQDTIVYTTRVRLGTGAEEKANINLKELKAQQGAAQAEAQKKQQEEEQKFEALKGHFEAGGAALDQAKTLRNDYLRAPADQKPAIKQKMDELYGTATTELQAAQSAMSETDINRHMVLAKLGEVYLASGKYEDAAATYQKAIELRPDQAGYYNNLGNAYGLLGKMKEAQEAYQKSAELDPQSAAMAYLNFTITLYNAGRLGEAIEPAKKSVELNPKSAQAWYLLGAALVNGMTTKKEGDKIIPVLLPGTAEAYQKAVELDPDGQWGKQAKEGLQTLEAMGAGIPTKVKQTKPAKKGP